MSCGVLTLFISWSHASALCLCPVALPTWLALPHGLWRGHEPVALSLTLLRLPCPAQSISVLLVPLLSCPAAFFWRLPCGVVLFCGLSRGGLFWGCFFWPCMGAAKPGCKFPALMPGAKWGPFFWGSHRGCFSGGPIFRACFSALLSGLRDPALKIRLYIRRSFLALRFRACFWGGIFRLENSEKKRGIKIGGRFRETDPRCHF